VVQWNIVPKMYTIQDNHFSLERFQCIWKADVKKIIIIKVGSKKIECNQQSCKNSVINWTS